MGKLMGLFFDGLRLKSPNAYNLKAISQLISRHSQPIQAKPLKPNDTNDPHLSSTLQVFQTTATVQRADRPSRLVKLALELCESRRVLYKISKNKRKCQDDQESGCFKMRSLKSLPHTLR